MATWHSQVKSDINLHGPEVVVGAIADTCKVTDENRMPAEARTALRWNNFPWWALPRPLSVVDDRIMMFDGLYYRSWVCLLNGVKIDGHLYVDQGSGACQVCGE
jgi:hypothetical protein